jgi:hypothetical protein
MGESRSMELRPRWEYAWLDDWVIRLISTPRKAKGAQHATDQDLCESAKSYHKGCAGATYTPQTAMISVAARKLLTNGAKIMELANRQWAIVHAVSKEGLYFSSPDKAPAKCFGGRGVKLGPLSSSGDFTKNGSITDITNVMMLKQMRA